MITWPAEAEAMLRTHRVGRLATADPQGQPHCMPVCFYYDGDAIFIPLDEKPKAVDVLKLRRVRNLLANPKVAFLLDHYDDNWDQLAWLHVQGEADLLSGTPPVQDGLRQRYVQYRSMALDTVIRIRPVHARGWRYKKNDPETSGSESPSLVEND